ncbi:MAG: CHASE4 domain-containing protein [Desulfuromonadaceae bacterium]|nr:CHASE4 domain-containing protein [Desulfuromonadaceae bacterium]
MKLSIQVKMILTVIVGVLLWGWLHYYIQQREILPSYHRQEELLIHAQTRHVRELLSYELEALDQFCYDWAAWDDSYIFIRDRNLAYIESNLVFTSFDHNNLNLIHYVDITGRKVWHNFYDLSRSEPYADDTFWSRPQWNMDEPFLQIKEDDGSLTGLIGLKQGVMLIAARPIIPSTGRGEIRGYLIMGRMLGGKVTSRINHHLRNKVEFLSWKQAEASFSADELNQLRQDMVLSRPAPDDVGILQGHIALFDLWGKPVVVAQMQMERTLMQQGEKALLRNVQGNLIAGSAVLLLMLVILHRFVVLPLRHLTSSVQHIGGDNAQWTELPESLKGEDEIGTLAREFERMLGRIRTQIEFKDEIAVKLERSKARTRLVLDTTPDAILSVSADGTIKASNRGADLMLGYEDGTLTGEKIYTILASPFSERLQEQLRTDARSCRCFTAGCEARARRRDGSELYVHVRGCPMEENPEPMYLWTIRDISELKEMHEQVSHHERLAAIGQMGASVAHDVRNPLTGISGGIQLLLKQGGLTPVQHTVLEEMLTLADRIEHTVTQMLAFSKRWEPSTQKINLVDFLQSIGKEFSARKEFANVTFAFGGERRLYVMADPELMRQVFNNLYQNAKESMYNGGSIGSVVTREAGVAKVLIKDSGAGMEQEIVSRVLEPFYSTKREGTGLGLSICRKIVEAHDGSMDFTSKPGVGTMVTVSLPLGNQELLVQHNGAKACDNVATGIFADVEANRHK